MSFLSRLFAKPLRLHDPVFSELRYIRYKDAWKNFFSGKCLFAPTGVQISFSIDADETGPTDAQRAFYRNIERNYESYRQKVRPLIEEQFRNWKEDFSILDFDAEFILHYLSIPRPEAAPQKWEMAFHSIHDQNHDFTIEFTGDESVDIVIDG